RVAAAHEADDAGQERQRPLAVGREQALVGQPQPHLLDPAQELAEAELLDRVRLEPELALALPQLAAAEDVDAVADAGRRLDAVELLLLHRAAQDRRAVLQAEVDEPPAVGALELRQLALDPDVAEPGQPVGDALVEPGHRVDGAVAIGGRLRLRAHAGSLGLEVIGSTPPARLDVPLSWEFGALVGLRPRTVASPRPSSLACRARVARASLRCSVRSRPGRHGGVEPITYVRIRAAVCGVQPCSRISTAVCRSAVLLARRSATRSG